MTDGTGYKGFENTIKPYLIRVAQSHQNKNPILFLPHQTALQKSNQLHYPLAHFYPFPQTDNCKAMATDG
ncbi:hypothetical protein [Moraxella bovis]|uniref:Uncharacterized protein n=1 Tax=Moraxella bovis TaxID=476 RepID=A0A378PSJ4_MORBO|nr:hypothetical protein [Moraxella bovis]STY91271.1 Uncharacterised protein [Moraxella bovis]